MQESLHINLVQQQLKLQHWVTLTGEENTKTSHSKTGKSENIFGKGLTAESSELFLDLKKIKVEKGKMNQF